MAFKKDFNVFVGTKTGILKALKVHQGPSIVKTIQNLKVLAKEHEITSMAWGDSDEREILIGLANQTVKIYDSDFKAFTSSIDVKCGEGPIIGLTRYDGSILTAVSSGQVKFWRYGEESMLETGGSLERMRHSPVNRDLIATGGKNNDLKLWNIGSGNKSTFKAKNVPHNSLELEVPVWVSDFCFLPDSSKVVVCTRYGQVRIYDPSAQRRPVMNVVVPEQALTSITNSSKPMHVVVGSGTGHMTLMDLRFRGITAGHYKGFTGSVRDIACHKSEPYIVSVSLDRHLRVHHHDSKALLHKEYLQSKLNCVLMRSDFNFKPVTSNDESEETTKKASEGVELVQLSDDEVGSDKEDMNDIFCKMETVTEEQSSKKRKHTTLSDKTKRKKTPST